MHWHWEWLFNALMGLLFAGAVVSFLAQGEYVCALWPFNSAMFWFLWRQSHKRLLLEYQRTDAMLQTEMARNALIQEIRFPQTRIEVDEAGNPFRPGDPPRPDN